MHDSIGNCPLDLEEALARAGDDREFLRELVEMFLADVPGRLGELRDALDAGDASRVAAAAHGIKGAAANLAAEGIRRVAFDLEMKGRNAELADAPAVLAALEEEIRGLADWAATF